jgi:hypothetical protein
MAVAAGAAGLIAGFCAQTGGVLTCHDVDGKPYIGVYDLCLNESGYSKAHAGIPVVFKVRKDLHNTISNTLFLVPHRQPPESIGTSG